MEIAGEKSREMHMEFREFKGLVLLDSMKLNHKMKL
jgi:hypothetical protein